MAVEQAIVTLPLLPATWQSDRLAIRDSTLNDVARLRTIFNACNYVERWDPTFYQVGEAEIEELVQRSISRQGVARRFRLQCITPLDGHEPVGYFHLSHGVPHPDKAWISMFVMHPEHQRHGYAREVVNSIAQQLGRLGYSALWLEVYLKNWPALRFWIGAGFTTIIEYNGEAQHNEQGNASLVLARALRWGR